MACKRCRKLFNERRQALPSRLKFFRSAMQTSRITHAPCPHQRANGRRCRPQQHDPSTVCRRCRQCLPATPGCLSQGMVSTHREQ